MKGVLASNVVHGEVEQAVGLAHVAEGHDVGVIQLAQDVGLAQERWTWESVPPAAGMMVLRATGRKSVRRTAR